MNEKSDVPQARTTVYAPLAEVKRLKAKLALKGLTISEWFRQKMQEELKKEN
jgi:F0F1-type ATP synthase beta subunit